MGSSRGKISDCIHEVDSPIIDNFLKFFCKMILIMLFHMQEKQIMTCNIIISHHLPVFND